MTMRAKVAVLKTSPEKVLEDIQRLFDLAEAEKYLAKDSPMILKENISWHFMYPGANTTPWQLEGTILGLRNRGYDPITCVGNNTVVTNPFKGERLNKLSPVLRKYQIPVLYNFRSQDMKWVKYEPKGEMLALHRVHPRGIHIPDYFIGKNIVHLPTVKCHVYTTMTGSLKNAFGGLLGTRRHYTHTWIHQVLVDLLTIQREIHPGIFTVMDGTTAGNGPGPRTMEPVIKNYILASADPVAIDAVAAKMMGFDPMSLDMIRLSHERGLGVGDPAEIEVVGEDVSGVNFHFKVGHNPATWFVSRFWWGWLKRFQKLFFHTPLVNFFIYGSFIFHDLIWFPFKGNKKVKKWLDETDWGRLFQKY